MAADLLQLLRESKTYLWALRFSETRRLDAQTQAEIKNTLANAGLDVATLASLRQLEPAILRPPYPAVQRATHNDYYFFPIPAFDIEVFFKTMICEPGVEVGMELFPGYVDWQFGHHEIQYCIGGDTEVEIVAPDNTELKRRVRVGDVVAAPNGTNFKTHSTEADGRFGHAHVFLTNTGRDVYYDVGGLLQQPVTLATEDEAAALFPDCDPGAVPPIGTAYGLGSLVDESLDGKPEIYFEGGDHQTLVHVSGDAFRKLMENVPHGRISAQNINDKGAFPYFGA
jgi:hypothetical protein